MAVTEQEWSTWAGDEYARIRIIQSGQMATDTPRYPVPLRLRKAWARACQPLRKGTALALMHLAERHGFEAQVQRWRLVYEDLPGDPDEWDSWNWTWRTLCTYDPVLAEQRVAHSRPPPR